MTQSASLSLIGSADTGIQSLRRQLVPLTELVTANRQRDALYLLSEQLHRAINVEEIYDAAMDAIESALGCDRSAILLFDDAGVMQFVASRGLSDEYRAAVTGHSPWKKDEADAVPIDIADVTNAELTTVSRQRFSVRTSARSPSFRWSPMARSSASSWRISASRYAFTKDDLAVSLAIARQLAFAIHRHRTNARLLRTRSGACR